MRVGLRSLKLLLIGSVVTALIHGAHPASATESPEIKAPPSVTPVAANTEQLYCEASVDRVVSVANRKRLKKVCAKIERIADCASVEGRPIQHIDFATSAAHPKRILVLGMIHGDEALAGEMALEWALRLDGLGARNTWRVIPMLNPDGFERKTRMNASGVDLNRNFPTRDWSDDAVRFWKTTAKDDPRRYPGRSAASEAETKCVIEQIKKFRPDFIVSVHTPYRVLDFDGPKMSFPPYRDLPWRALGNFPGSLGRYMWRDYQIPVLTVELGSTMVDAGRLQDIVGTFAIEASKRAGTKTVGLFDRLLDQ